MEAEDGVIMASEGLDWKFSQVFGERTANEEVQEAICFVFLYVLREALKKQATKNPTRRQIQIPPRSPGTLPRVSSRGSDNSGVDINGSTYNFSTKLLHLAWHPNENTIACAASNGLYMYYA